jgi:hypothetical protein
MVLGQPLADVRRQQERLLAITRNEVLRHALNPLNAADTIRSAPAVSGIRRLKPTVDHCSKSTSASASASGSGSGRTAGPCPGVLCCSRQLRRTIAMATLVGHHTPSLTQERHEEVVRGSPTARARWSRHRTCPPGDSWSMRRQRRTAASSSSTSSSPRRRSTASESWRARSQQRLASKSRRRPPRCTPSSRLDRGATRPEVFRVALSLRGHWSTARTVCATASREGGAVTCPRNDLH